MLSVEDGIRRICERIDSVAATETADLLRGTKGVGGIKDPMGFMRATMAAKQVLADNAVTGQGLPKYGTQVLMNVINEVGSMRTRNHRDVQFEGAKDISVRAELHRGTVDAVALMSWRRTIGEYMPQMASAIRTVHLGLHHAMAAIDRRLDCTVDRIIETGPSRAALQFQL